MNKIDIAWVAGIIEGEGAIMLTKNPMRVRVRVQMTDQDVIESLYEKTGLGCTDGDGRKPSTNRKQIYQWEVRKQHEVEQLLVAIRPFMHSRRTRKLDEVLDWIRSRVIIKPCAYCKEDFPAAQPRHVFCSEECRVWKRNRIGEYGMKYGKRVI